jgi:hypothetical protein
MGWGHCNVLEDVGSRGIGQSHNGMSVTIEGYERTQATRPRSCSGEGWLYVEVGPWRGI